MKKLSILLIFSVFISMSCSNASEDGGAEAQGAQSEMAVLSDKGDGEAAKGKPIHLDKPAVIDFYADWCRPCRMIAPIMEELAAEYEGEVHIYKIDTEAQRELASVFGITSLPTVLFVPAEGRPSAQKGALPKESYKKIIDEFLLNKNTQTQ